MTLFNLWSLSNDRNKKDKNAVFYKVNGDNNKEVGSVKTFYDT